MWEFRVWLCLKDVFIDINSILVVSVSPTVCLLVKGWDAQNNNNTNIKHYGYKYRQGPFSQVQFYHLFKICM